MRHRETEFAQPTPATLLDELPAMIGYWDKNLICRNANRAYSLFFDVDSASLPGMHLRALLGIEIFDGNLRYVEAALSGTAVRFERMLPSRGHAGSRHTIVHFVPDVAAGAVRGFHSLEYDVTEIVESNHRLAALIRDSEGLLSTLHQQALLSVADNHGRFTDANEGFCTISGYARGELLGKNHSVLRSGVHTREFWQALWHTLNAGNPWRGEICNRNKNGSLYWVDSIISPCFNASGRIVKFISIRFDITSHKIAQQKLQESQAFLERAEKISGVGGFMIDLASGTQQWTRQAYAIHDIEPGRSPAAELTDAFLAAIRAKLLCALQGPGAGESGAGCDIEMRLVTAKGRPIWIRVTSEVERMNGAPARIVGAMQDITERRLMEQKLRDATALAEKASESKSQFLANMSHEIRTPLNAVIGLGYLLEQTALGEDQRELLAKIQFAGRSLLGIVNNVLDLSKVEAGEMALEEQALNLADLVRDVGQMMGPQAAEKGIDLQVECADDLPDAVIGDPLRLRQILVNLVSNSIKFTAAGYVEIKAWCLTREPAGILLRCEVRDSGIGIEPKALDGLFTPFSQADASTTRRFGGTGLGLSIARRFVELMDGRIGVTSTRDVGSTFWIEIPLRVCAAADRANGAEKNRDLRVLIADAQRDGFGDLGLLVRALGWVAQVVTTGEGLIAELARTPAGAWPDVLIIEQNLPDVDQQQLMTRLKKECTPHVLPPIAFVTDLAQSYIDSASLLQPTGALLVRPVTVGALFNAVNSLLWTVSRNHAEVFNPTSVDGQEAQWLKGVRVLVADDSDINCEVVRRILENQGAIVTTCGDGRAALENVSLHHAQLDIVLMDVQMPYLDGNEATRRIRSELKLATLPIVALTAGVLLSETQRALESGMNQFISKPFKPLDLVGKVRRLVEEARRAPIPMVFIGTRRDREVVGGLPPSIDAAAVHRMLGVDESLFRSLLASMLRNFEDLALPPSLPLDEPAGRRHLESRAHKLMGSAGLIGANNIERLARTTGEALREGRSPEVVAGILEELAAALVALRHEAAPHSSAPPMTAHGGASIIADSATSGADIEELCALLENQNLAAVDRFTVLADSLSERLGGPRFDRLRDAIENLDFQRGAEVLR